MIAHIMTSPSRGGLEHYVCDLIAHLAEIKVKQILICDSHSFLIQELKSTGLKIYPLRSGSRYSLSRIFRLRAIFKKEKITIIHSHTRDDMVLSTLASFFNARIRRIFSLYMGFGRKKDLLHRLIYGKLEALVTTSNLMNQLALEKLPVSNRQVRLIRYGRDDALFKVKRSEIDKIRKALKLTAQDRLVLSLCRIDPMKGVREFAAASNLMPRHLKHRWLFLQIGERTLIGHDAKGEPLYLPDSQDAYLSVKKIADQQGNPTTYQMLPFQKNYIPYLCAADYFVLGSYDEMYSLSVIDAMMAGLPVIGTNNGGTTEQLALDRGLLIEAKNPQAIVDAEFSGCPF